MTDEDGIDGPALRASCRVCRRLYAVKSDGSIRGHQYHGRPCAGSGLNPEAK